MTGELHTGAAHRDLLDRGAAPCALTAARPVGNRGNGVPRILSCLPVPAMVPPSGTG
jgi:hypothetical protein